MREGIRTTIVFVIVAALYVPGAAQQAAKISRVEDHALLSVPTRSGATDVLYYEVCNNSKGRSGFFWRGAGFGVDSRSQLAPGRCAHKRNYVPRPHKPTPQEISFQGRNKKAVETWIAADAGLVNTITGSLESFAELADGTVAMETLTLTLSRDPKTGGGRLTVRTSEGFEHVLVAFPNKSGAVEDLQAAFGNNKEIQIQTFAYFREQYKIEATFLAEDVPPKSPVIAIPKQNDGVVDQTLSIGQISRIGAAAVLLAIDKDKRVAVRNDVMVPVPPANK